MQLADTIVAISSAAGAAARMIVRLSGRDSLPLARGLCTDVGEAAGAARRSLSFDDLTVPAWVYVFRGPRSYTGDDLVEFHLPGNPLLARMLLDALTRAGARPADPGEFTARAYFNGRLDLAEAEGVAATIAAGNEQELAAARQLLSGELSRRLRPTMDLVAETLALVEVGIDFAEEDVSFLPAAELARRAAECDAALARLLDESGRFEPLSHEPTIVLVGRPNAGKSTLLNALAGRERAVVSPIAGTTRDALSAEVALPRGIVRLIDVAGIDADAGGSASGPAADIERQMRDRALRTAEGADVLVLVRDATDPAPAIATPRPPDVTVRTKADLLSSAVTDVTGNADVAVSAVTALNLDRLRAFLDLKAFGDGGGGGGGGAALALNARHVTCVQEARSALNRAAASVAGGSHELVALELREALDALGRVLGAVTPDDLLGRIFSSFCIGK